MRVVHHLSHCPEAFQGCAVALGNFDGIHLGHQALIKETLKIAEKLNCPPAILTFEPHPLTIIKPDLPPLRLTPFHLKATLLKEMGIKVLYIAKFNTAFSKITATDFVKSILAKKLKSRHVLTGENFIFGHNREGNVELLQTLCNTLSIGYSTITCLQSRGTPFSSTAARKALKEANLDEVSKILGRPHIIEGRVREGKKKGSAFGFPTANVLLKNHFHPAFGIYCVSCKTEGSPSWLPGVASLGINPMYPEPSPVLEVHIFNCSKNLYGRRLKVKLLKFLRAEKAFETEAALIKQMEADSEQAKQFFAHT